MPVTLNPYLSFRGEARAALEHYRSVLGGALDISTFGQMHASRTPEDDELVMHGRLTSDELTLMASDTPEGMDLTPGTNISISLSGDDEATLTRYYEGLSEGGTISMPLQKAIWGDIFAMWTDRFGIGWLVNITGTAVG